MISAGQDPMRNKKGTRNTYLRGDLNEIDYSKSEEFADLRSDLKASSNSAFGRCFIPSP